MHLPECQNTCKDLRTVESVLYRRHICTAANWKQRLNAASWQGAMQCVCVHQWTSLRTRPKAVTKARENIGKLLRRTHVSIHSAGSTAFEGRREASRAVSTIMPKKYTHTNVCLQERVDVSSACNLGTAGSFSLQTDPQNVAIA